jgi:ABC-type lipopolysaccharide export system ATPase subunit
MSGTPEQDAVKATKEDGIIAEAARLVGRHQARPLDDQSPLQTIKCTIQFGGLVAVNALDMNVHRGEIYGLIGPNGAGKTTVFNLLTGVYKPTSGEIYFQGKRIDGLRSYEISRRGVSRTFQNIRLFPSMSVLENVMTACHRHAKQNLADAVLRLPRFERDEQEHRDFALELLEIFDLARVRDEGGTSLPYGSQRNRSCTCHSPSFVASRRTGGGHESLGAGRLDALDSADKRSIFTNHPAG